MNRKALSGRLALLAAALIWGSSFIIMKDTVSDVPVYMLLAVRFVISAVLMTVLFLPRLRKAGKQVLLPGAVCGVLLMLAYASQTFGLTDTTPGKNAFLTSVYCVLVPFVSWIIFRSRPTVYNWMAAFLCLTGIGFISLQGSLSIGYGDAMTLLSGVFWALHVTALGHYSSRHDPIALTTIQFAVTAAISTCCTLIFEPSTPLPSPDVLPQLLYLAVFATAIALFLQTYGQKLTPAAPAAILLSLESVFGAAFSLLTGGDVLSLQLVIGFALIFISVIISETQLSFLRKRI